MKRVVVFQRRLTNYRVPLFESMRGILAKQDVELQVVYGSPNAEDRLRNDSGTMLWGYEIPTRYFRLGKQRLVWHSLPWRLILGADLVILPHEGTLLANYPLIALYKLLGKTWAFWGHGKNLQIREHKNYARRIKNWLSIVTDWWFAYTSLSVQKVMEGGFPAERITCLDNSIDIKNLIAWRDSINEVELDALKKGINLQGKRLAVFLGSLTLERRLDFLFPVADELRRRLPDFELLIIGDGQQRKAVLDFAASRPWCRWVGAMHDRNKALFLSLGHIMLNPGSVGLNILDSFAFGIPLLTTDCGIHSPEIIYLESGRNGLMTTDDQHEYADEAERLLTDTRHREDMRQRCIENAQRYSLENMVENFCTGILQALGGISIKEEEEKWHVAVIWQRFLSYHKASIRHLQARFSKLGYRLTAIEVASQDESYGFPEDSSNEGFERYCCFPGVSYHQHNANEIYEKVISFLNELKPDIVFAPATPFPEGMAAITYRVQCKKVAVMMDDAWEYTDKRGFIIRQVKRLIHKNVDAVFIPAPSHMSHYINLGFPRERIVFGVYAVDNNYFFQRAKKAYVKQGVIRESLKLPKDYFLFVGRFLPRKGIDTLIAAYANYRAQSEDKCWGLVLVGTGNHLEHIKELAENTPGVHFVGPKFGDDLCIYYSLSHILIVPSISDQWGLVINEGMASALPVIVSKGCGAAKTLVREGENGWTFEPGDIGALTRLMLYAASLPSETLENMGKKSQKIINEWSLDRFTDGVMEAINIPRRHPAGPISNMVTRLWKGIVRVY